MSWRDPSPGGGPPIAPVRGGPTAQVTVQTTPMSMTIDTTQGRREMKYYKLTELAHVNWQKTERKSREGIKAIVQRGERMAAIENGGNAIKEISFRRMLAHLSDKEFRINFVPLSPPKIHFQPGSINIDVVY